MRTRAADLPSVRASVLAQAGKITVAVAAVLLVALFTAVVIRHGRPFSSDLALHRWSLAHRPGAARAVAADLTATGVGVVPYVLALAAGALTGRGARGRALAAVAAMLVLLVVQLLRFGLATAIGRSRPPSADWAVHVSGFAFPSGHTVTSATAAGLLIWALCRRDGGWPRTVAVSLLALWAAAVGLTRIYLGVHWPTDVAGGWLMTVLLLGLAAMVLPRLPAVRPRDGDPAADA
ncbi:phosphatase PAP2 family protein [Actinoallomurus sp. NBC_01490]|jgi:undecaprenyl-diphosphatase|uniref:phosphatase PAP2 family protein n=1 Tax=Actinoallomurus sp. NBC_01490 TaxID=2903557 RepID=UPI002E33B79C|nr:phosphatase PAP2 family protein [Actinoallomurus sp. NBC_01490]